MYAMIDRVIELKDAYVNICNSAELQPFTLLDSDWEYLGQVKTVLQPFQHMTTSLSAATYPTIPLTILAYNKLMDAIEDFRDSVREDSHYSDICNGANEAWQKLSKYYTKTESGPIYAVATALHPGMCFNWWSQKKWESVYVDAAKQAVCDVWLEYEDVMPTQQ
ncbi:hypothetical protein BGZ59_004775 [Podila verticillata]|nr:hypothetical protein BGZ59_004775 [Podila verticillata]